jgi:cytochrome P450
MAQLFGRSLPITTTNSTPPGPRGGFIRGSLAQMNNDYLGFFAGLARDYGDISTFRLGPVRCCLVNRPEWIEEILVRDAANYTKTWDYKALKTILGDGLVTSEGDLWRRQRRLVQPAFDHNRMDGYIARFGDRTAEMLETWEGGTQLNIHQQMMRLTLRIVGDALFSSELGEETIEVAEMMASVNEQFGKMFSGGLGGLLLIVPSAVKLLFRSKLKRVDRIIHRMIEWHRGPDGVQDDLVGMLLAARDENGSGMADRQIRDEIMTILLAGHETTALALFYSLHLISRHPEMEQRLLEECSGVLEG